MRLLLSLALLLAGSPAFTAEPLRVGVVVFEGFLSGEVVAPLEVFTKATSEPSPRFDVFTVGASVKPVRSHEGLLVQPRVSFTSCPPLDILVVPSALEMDPVLADQALVAFIKQRGARARYVASHCAGAFLLGKAGLLDGKRATTSTTFVGRRGRRRRPRGPRPDVDGQGSRSAIIGSTRAALIAGTIAARITSGTATSSTPA